MTNVASKNVNILLLVRNWSLSWIKCVSNSRCTWMITKLRYCFQSWMRDLFCWKISILTYIQFLKLRGGGGCRFFYRCILNGSALKHILHGFPLILYWTYENSKIFVISRIIFRHRCVFRWPSTTVTYYGIVNSLLHRFSFRNWMEIWLFDCNLDSYCVQYIFSVSRK